MTVAAQRSPSAGRFTRPRGRRPAAPEPLRHARSRAAALERELIVAAQRHENGARARVTDRFLPLIVGMAGIYSGSRVISRGEFVQEGVVGLLRAVDRFDPALGTPFWAYASWWVRQAMQSLVAELSRPVVLSDRAIRQLARVKDAQLAVLQSQGREPSTQELADRVGIETQQVQQLMSVERRPRGLEEPVRSSGETVGTFADLLPDPRAQDAYDRVPHRLAAESLPGLLERLDEREQTIVRARFGLDGAEQTLVQIGRRLGVSAERVRQIEERALGKLHAAATRTFPAR